MSGHSSAKTDRGAQLGARQGLWNIFNYALPQGQQQQQAGQTNVAAPESYYRDLLTGGRSKYAQLSAPGVNAATDQAGAQARQASEMGTARGGGTAATQAQAGATTQKTIDDIINENMMQGRQAGATGLEQIGTTQLENGLRMLGLSESAVNEIMQNATESRKTSQQIHDQAAAGYGQAIGTVLGFL